jgi:hypothetical protein
MRNEFASFALSAFLGLSSSLDASAADPAVASEEPYVVEKIGERRFRLVNNSTEPLIYMQWLNQEKKPVPYCRNADDSVLICSREKPIIWDGKPALEEASLRPGKSVIFDAAKGAAVAVGVRLRIDGKEHLLWHEL